MLSYGFQEKGLLCTPPIPRYSLNFLFLLMMWVPPPPSQLVRTTLVVLQALTFSSHCLANGGLRVAGIQILNLPGLCAATPWTVLSSLRHISSCPAHALCTIAGKQSPALFHVPFLCLGSSKTGTFCIGMRTHHIFLQRLGLSHVALSLVPPLFWIMTIFIFNTRSFFVSYTCHMILFMDLCISNLPYIHE